MKIFLAGGTGFLGRYLSNILVQYGHEITLLVRSTAFTGQVEGNNIHIVIGDPSVRGNWQECCAAHEAVINLAGASIFRPWTAFARKTIFESRIRSTENIVEAIMHGQRSTNHFFNASGVGYYGYCKDAVVDETKPSGNTFLAQLAHTWEATALRARETGARVILCRFGIVLGQGGGAFQRILPLAKLHLNAPWGSGNQWFSWIHERDVAEIFSFLLDHENINGPINFTSPEPVTNRAMIGILNKTLNKKPFIPSIPAWVLRSILGDFSNVFLEGQRVVPSVLKKHGFLFHFPTFTQAAADLIQSSQRRFF